VTIPDALRVGPRRSPRRFLSTRSPRTRLLIAMASIVMVVAAVGGTVGVTLALFTGSHSAVAAFGTKAIFPGERVTPAFQVGDASSGSEVDRSSSFATTGDGLTTTTGAWPTAFAADHFLEFDLNDSLAAGVPVSTAQFDLSFASGGAGQACFYVEVRTASTGTPIATYGSPGSPLGCVTGTSISSFSVPLPAVSSTDIANDLRIRVFGADSLGGSMTVDRATVSGSTPYQSFTLYPVVFRDVADGSPTTVPWSLDAP
jgi:hypothetical protein